MFEKIFIFYFKGKKFKGILELEFSGKKYFFGEKIEKKNNEEIEKIDIKVLDKNFFKRVILFGDTGFGESFFLKEFETSDLKSLLLWFLQNKNQLPGFREKNLFFSLFSWALIPLRFEHFWNRNTKEGSKKNIKAHYDISNDFYELWLDETMTYSSAVFTDSHNLSEAQKNKYKRICEKINLKKDDQLLEIGCGWGGFSIYAATNYGCQVTAVTISEKQFEYVEKRIKKEGLEDKIKVFLKDYRDLEGGFDKIVSIEMVEALGHKYISLFVEKCNSLLIKNGSICIQCITYPDDNFEEYIKNPNFIKKYIFPGGELISFKQLKKEIIKNNLEIISSDSIGFDYAKTLSIWRDNFLRQKENIFRLGFDEEFYRKWLYYFAYCEVGFEKKYIDDIQLLINK